MIVGLLNSVALFVIWLFDILALLLFDVLFCSVNLGSVTVTVYVNGFGCAYCFIGCC